MVLITLNNSQLDILYKAIFLPLAEANDKVPNFNLEARVWKGGMMRFK